MGCCKIFSGIGVCGFGGVGEVFYFLLVDAIPVPVV